MIRVGRAAVLEHARQRRACVETASWRRDSAEPPTRSTRSIRSGRASAARPRRSCAASRSSRPSSIRPSCITTRSKPRSCTASSQRLDHPDVPAELIRQAYAEALEDDPAIGDRVPRRHRRGVRPRSGDRTASSSRCSTYKGFHAIQTHRLAHWLWSKGRKDFALLSAEPLVGGVPDRHPSGGADRPRHLPRPCHRARRRRDRGDRGRRLDPAGRDARRHRQGTRRPPSQDPPRRA